MEECWSGELKENIRNDTKSVALFATILERLGTSTRSLWPRGWLRNVTEYILLKIQNCYSTSLHRIQKQVCIIFTKIQLQQTFLCDEKLKVGLWSGFLGYTMYNKYLFLVSVVVEIRNKGKDQHGVPKITVSEIKFMKLYVRLFCSESSKSSCFISLNGGFWTRYSKKCSKQLLLASGVTSEPSWSQKWTKLRKFQIKDLMLFKKTKNINFRVILNIFL